MENPQVLSDIVAETAILSGIFNSGQEVYYDISDIVNTDSFSHATNQFIWKVLDKYYKEHKEPLDIPTFVSTAGFLGLTTFFGQHEHLSHLRTVVSSPVESNNLRKLAAKIRKLQIGRSAKIPLTEAARAIDRITGEETLSHIVGLVENPIFDWTTLLNDKQDGPEQIFASIEEYVEWLGSNPVKQMGISTGYPYFDMAIGGGCRRKSVSLVAARAKQGKTILASSMAKNVAAQKIHVLNLDTEMNKNDQRHRMLGAISGVPTNEIETGQFALDPEKKRKVQEAAKYLKSIEQYYTYQNISGWAFEDTISTMRRWLLRTVGHDSNGVVNNCLIVYDYIKLMSADILASAKLQEYQALGFLMTSLHNFAVKYDVPILSFVQLNRDGITREDTDIVAGSDRIVWLASNLTLLKKQSDEEIAEQRSRHQKTIYFSKLVPLIARHGGGLEADNDFIHVQFDRPITSMKEGPLESELKYNYSLASNSQGEILNEADIPNDKL